MKKMEKRLRRDSVKVERYTCAECLPAGCTCASGVIPYESNKVKHVQYNESLSYRRS